MVRSSLVAARYAGKFDLKRISSEAAVDLVLMGTLLRSGGQLRASAQLVEAAGGTVVWSQTAQGGLQDAFQLQDQVVTRIVERFPGAPVYAAATCADLGAGTFR